MSENGNGYVKWSIFKWIVGGFAALLVIICGYMIQNDIRARSTLDLFNSNLMAKLDNIGDKLTDVKCSVAAMGTEIYTNTKRIDVLEVKSK